MQGSKYEIKIYKIWWEDAPDELIIYFGSTKEKRLSNRITCHRKHCKSGLNNRLYQVMREKGYDFKYCQLVVCLVLNGDEQRMLEQQCIDKLKPPLNMNRAYGLDPIKRKQSQIRYARNNREKIQEKQQDPEYKERMRAYSKAHPKQTKDCVCGGRFTDYPSRKKRHRSSKKHII